MKRCLGEKSELILKSAQDLEQVEYVKPYWDPKLRYNRKAYHSLVKKLHDIGNFQYTTQPAASVGVFFVWKSSRTKLRMITDARLANQHFKVPPSVSLLSSEGFGRIEVVLSEKAQSRLDDDEAIEAFMGISDVRDCFHRMRVPVWLSRYFAWEPVPAKVVGLSGSIIDGVKVGPLDAVWPCAGSLCQGWTWSLYFAQRANEHLCSATHLLREARLASDRGPSIIFNVKAGCESTENCYVYVDNLGVLGLDRSRVEASLEELQAKFNGLGLQLHKSEVGSDKLEALGCIVDGKGMKSSITPHRLWKLRQAITGLLRHRQVSGRAVEVLVGHLTFCGLMARPALSIFSACYAFIQAAYEKSLPLWPTVRRELLAFKGILFLLNQDWWRPWNCLVTSSDSSLTGYGICHAWWPRSQVQETGRNSERSRFRRVGPHSAREAALQAAGFVKKGAAWEPAGDRIVEQLGEAGWCLDPSFPEVPAAGLRRELWTPKVWGKWRHPEKILILEARTILMSLKRILMTKYGCNMRQLLLSDNMSCVLSFERSRSRNFVMLKILREFGAYCLARNVAARVRWIPSELNISDEPSRFYDEEESKLLVDLLAESWLHHGPSPLSHFETGAGADDKRSVGQKNPCRENANPPAPERAEPTGALTAAKEESPRSGSSSQAADDRAQGDVPAPPCQRGGTSCPERPSEEECKLRKREREHFIRAQGREARRSGPHRQRQAKKGAAQHGRQGNGGGHVFSGVCISHPDSEAGIPATTCGSGCLREEETAGLQLGLRGGPGAREVLQRRLLERRGKSHRRLHDGGPVGQVPRVRQAWQPEDSQSLALPEGMAQVVPISLEACIPPCSLVRHQLENDTARSPPEGPLQPPPGLFLPPTRSTPQVAQDGTGAADQQHHRLLVAGDELDGDQRHVEDWHQGRSILLDSEWMQFAGLLYKILCQGGSLDWVWGFNYGEYLSVFHQSCADLKVNLVPYQARHSGPSIDRARGARTHRRK